MYSGSWPVVPTPFFEDGRVDCDRMKSVSDFTIDCGVCGLWILANFSEQFFPRASARDVWRAGDHRIGERCGSDDGACRSTGGAIGAGL